MADSASEKRRCLCCGDLFTPEPGTPADEPAPDPDGRFAQVRDEALGFSADERLALVDCLLGSLEVEDSDLETHDEAGFNAKRRDEMEKLVAELDAAHAGKTPESGARGSS